LNQPRATLISVIFDRGIGPWPKKYNKRIEILIPAGKHSPQWVYAAGAEQILLSSTVTANQLIICRYHGIPLLQQKFGNVIKKNFGERYDASPYLSYVIMTGFGHSTETWFRRPGPIWMNIMPSEAMGNGLKGAKWFAALYNKAFPTTHLSLIAMCPTFLEMTKAEPLLKKFVEDSVKDYPHRFGL